MENNYSEDELPLRLGNVIRQYRNSKNLTQEMLAEQSDLTTTYIGKVERGVSNPTINTLYKITTALDISLNDLFDLVSLSDDNSESIELLSFYKYLRDLPPERVKLYHEFLKNINS